MLASQINPHFLYNTLETIRMKAKINKEPEIEELVKMLAKIMRRNIQVSDKKVTLKSEVQLIEYYLKYKIIGLETGYIRRLSLMMMWNRMQKFFLL